MFKSATIAGRLFPVLATAAELVGTAVVGVMDSNLLYWVARVALLSSITLLVSQLRDGIAANARRNAFIAVAGATAFDVVSGLVQFPTRSPLGAVIALIGAVVGALTATVDKRTARYTSAAMVLVGWSLWTVPTTSVATVVLTAFAVIAPGVSLLALVSNGRTRITYGVVSVVSWLSAGSMFGVVWSVGTVNKSIHTQWVGITALSIAIAFIAFVLTSAIRSEKLRRAGIAVALVLGVASGTFTSAQADNVPRTAPVALEEAKLTGNGMTADKGAGPKAKFKNMTFDQCDKLDSRDCYITYFDQIAKAKGLAEAVEQVVIRVKLNEGSTFPKHCHQAIHNLGQASMEATGNDFTKALLIDPQVCGTGFVHGLYELAMNAIGKEQLFNQTGSICKDLGMNNDYFRWNCSHILGHLLMTLSMDNPAKAMEYCVSIDNVQNQTDCLAGGWMNFFQDDMILDYARERSDVKMLFEVCYGAQAGLVKLLCYQELFPAIYSVVNGDDYAAGKACAELSEPTEGTNDPWSYMSLDYRDRCAQGIARAVAVGTDYDYRRIPARCLSMPAVVRDGCLTSAAGSVATNTGSLSAAIDVCKYVKADRYRANCYFFAKQNRMILTQGPNATNLPKTGEVRIPGIAPGISAGTKFDEVSSAVGVPRTTEPTPKPTTGSKKP